MRGLRLPISILVFLGLFMTQNLEANAHEFRVGDPFPELVLPSLTDGSPLSISSFRGQKLILHIWASW